VEEWNDGMYAGIQECWKSGILGLKALIILAIFQYSIVPIFFHHSTIPELSL
jgi:hypothetical protein